MQIYSNNNAISFNARNKQIRFADDIARKVNKEFPRISPSKIEGYKLAKKHENIIETFWNDLHCMRETIKTARRSPKMLQKIELLFKSIKEYKLGNCGESADLAVIIEKMNGIKNCYHAHLENPHGGDFDHAIVLVKDKKPYIIDSWLGFADYVDNAIKKYQTIYSKYFDFKNYGHKMVIKVGNYTYNDAISPTELAKLKIDHPELLISV